VIPAGSQWNRHKQAAPELLPRLAPPVRRSRSLEDNFELVVGLNWDLTRLLSKQKPRLSGAF